MKPFPTPSSSSNTGSVRVWDPFVRLFHWSLVSCVVLNQFVLEGGKAPHEWAGYVASTLVLARLLWGFVGSGHAHFADFFPTPARLSAHAKALLKGQHPRYVGHSPIGAVMMLALMTVVIALGVTGWLQRTDAFWGEEWLQDLHGWLADGLLVGAGLHGAAALLLGRLERVRLIRAMFTGVKESY